MEVAPDPFAHIMCSCPLTIRTAKGLVRRDLDTFYRVSAGTLKHKCEKQTGMERKPGSDSGDWLKCRLWGHLQHPSPEGLGTTGMALGLYSANGISPGHGSVDLSTCVTPELVPGPFHWSFLQQPSLAPHLSPQPGPRRPQLVTGESRCHLRLPLFAPVQLWESLNQLFLIAGK